VIRPPGPYKAPRFSPDWRRLALQVSEGGRSRIWLYDIQRAVMSRLTADGPADEVLPLWTPDGRRIVFSSDRDARGEPHLFWKQVDGSDVPSRLTDIPRTEQELAGSLLSDGKDLLYVGTDPNGLVYRVNRKTKDVFVLFDAPESEISCLALDKQDLQPGLAEIAREDQAIVACANDDAIVVGAHTMLRNRSMQTRSTSSGSRFHQLLAEKISTSTGAL